MNRWHPLAFAAGLVGLGWSSPARASGLDSPQVGSGGSSPLTADAAAVHWNPGQLGFLDRGSFDFGAGVIVGRIGYERERLGQYQYSDNFDFAEPVPAADLDASATGPAQAVGSTPVGPLVDLFVAAPVIPGRLVLGGGLYIPYAATLDFPDDGPQRFALQSISLVSLHTTLSAAVKVHDRVSIGAGATYVFSFLELSKVQDFGSVGLLSDALAQDPIGQENDFGVNAPSTVRELDVMARPISIERAISHSPSFNVGLAVQATDRVNLGLVYQHGSRLRFRGDFQLNMDDDFFTQDLASQGLQYPALIRGKTEVEMRLPKRITLGAGIDATDRVRIDAWASYATYQEFDVIDIELSSPDLAQPELGVGPVANQPLVRDWQGTFHIEVAPRIEVTERLRINTLVGYHSPASPDSTLDVASPDGHRLIFGGGVDVSLNDRWSLLADLEGQAILPRTVTTSTHDLANGRYSLFLGQLGLHARMRFGAPGAPQEAK
ncbi:MAG: outer membrane protein transport protein [Nannocystaceae bacterium]|nr:outer membrane protein transport protein [Nannocystaceae bacterium]